MISKKSRIAVVTSSREEGDLFTVALASSGYKTLTTFTSGREAYEVAIRQQFEVFVTRAELADMHGLVFIQKIRETGNYGIEPHLIVTDKLTASMANILYEHNLPYVLVPPHSKASLIQKFEYLVTCENSLNENETMYRDARAAFSQGLLEMAEELGKQTVQRFPDSEKAYVLLGDIQAKKEQAATARNYYKKALELNPKSASAAHKLAYTYMLEGDYDKSAKLYNSLAELNPYNITLLERAGLSNYNIANYEEAKKHLSRLKEVDESNKEAGVIGARIKIAEGDYDGIVAALAASHNEKEIAQFLNNAAVKLSQGNDVQNAIKMYEACLIHLNGSAYYHKILFNLAHAYRRLGDKQTAQLYYKKALADKPDFDKAKQALQEMLQEAQKSA